MRYQSLGLSAYDASVLVADSAAGRLFEATLAADGSLDPKVVANWVTGPVLALVRAGTPIERVGAGELATLLARVGAGELSGTNAKEVLALHADSGASVASVVEARGL